MWINDGSGSFTLKPQPIFATVWHDVDLADFDGDGKLDAVFASPAGFINVFRGDGTGTFGPGAAYVNPIASYETAVGDLNGDGKPDIVAVGRQTGNCRIYWNQGK